MGAWYAKAQLLKAKDNLHKMLAAIPLTDDERAAVDNGHSAMDAHLARLTDARRPPDPRHTRSGCHRPSIAQIA